MNIGDVEQRTGISKKNIRFYEKEGLLTVARNQENQYREYSEADVRTLEQIKLLRRLGVSLEDIRLVQDGRLSLADCMEKYSLLLKKQADDMRRAAEMCQTIRNSQEDYASLQPEGYLVQIDELEKKGARFVDIARDFVRAARNYFGLPKYDIMIEPEEPVNTPREFTMELARWADKEGRHLVILRESMVPLVEVDGQRYMGVLQIPHSGPPFSAWLLSFYALGFRFIYLYKLNEDGEVG